MKNGRRKVTIQNNNNKKLSGEQTVVGKWKRIIAAMLYNIFWSHGKKVRER